MLKINTHITLYARISFLLLISLFAVGQSFGQTNLTDGEITYAIKVTNPGNLNQQAVDILEKGQVIYNFKNNLFRSEMNIGSTEHVNVRNSKDNTGFSLIKGDKSQNYLIKMSAADFEKEDKKFAGLTFSTQNVTKEIAGYNCVKAIGKTADGKDFIVYYTKDLQPPYRDYNPRFKGLGGIPLAFEVHIEKNNATILMTADKVESDFQSSSLFTMPTSGFRLLTYDELQQLRGKQ